MRTLLEAWRQLRDVPLKVVGDGPLLGEMRAVAERERLPVEFVGMQPRAVVLDLIGRADLQVIASECFEGFPLVLVESYARGTPVVASKIGSLAELVDARADRPALRGGEPRLAGRRGAPPVGRIRSSAP